MFKNAIFVLFILPLIFLTSCGKSKSETIASTDTKTKDEIQKNVSDFVAAWNSHDSKSMAEFWATDGDLLSPLDSNTYTGRTSIEKHFSEEHTDLMKDSSINVSVEKVRQIDPDTAFVDIDLTISGMTIAGEKAVPFRNHGIFLFVKRDGRWQVLIARPY